MITEAELHGYVDGVLPDMRRREVEAYLADHSGDAARVRDWQAQGDALKRLFDPVLDEPVPARLAELRPRARRSWRPIAIAAGWVTIGIVTGWLLRGTTDNQQREGVAFARQAALAHAVYSPEVRHPVEVGVGERDHLIAWLSKRLGAPLRTPELGALGYDLVGGRLLPGSSGPAAQFMYQDSRGQRLTLFVRTDATGNRETAFRFAEQNGVRVFYWLDHRFGYALSGEVDRAELERIASAVYKQIVP